MNDPLEGITDPGLRSVGEKFIAMVAERDQWKAHHDNQVALKRKLSKQYGEALARCEQATEELASCRAQLARYERLAAAARRVDWIYPYVSKVGQVEEGDVVEWHRASDELHAALAAAHTESSESPSDSSQ